MLADRLRCLAAAIAVAGWAACGHARADETVKIGLILPLTGAAAPIGASLDRGAGLYVKLPRGELPAGIKLHIIRRDDGSEADTTRRIAQELIVRERVHLIAGIGLSPQGFAIAPVVTESKT